MKYVAAALVPMLCLAVPAGAQSAGESATVTAPATDQLALAREIVDYGFPPETRMDVFGGVMQQVVTQMNASQRNLSEGEPDPELEALVDKYQQRAIDEGIAVLGRHLDPMMEAMAVAYTDIFTPAELEALHAYVSSPEGRGFLAKSSAVNAHPAYVAASQGFMDEYLAAIPAMQEDMRAELIEMMQRREEESSQS